MRLFSRTLRTALILGLVWLSFVAISCTTLQVKRAPETAAPDVRKELSQIQIDIAAQSYSRALQRLQQIERQHPGTDAALDAAMLRGDIHFSLNEFTQAYDAYMSVINSNYFFAHEVSALIKAAESLYRLGRIDEALGLTRRSLRVSGVSPENRAEIFLLRFKILNMMGDRLEALRSLIYLAENHPDSAARDSFRVQALDYVETRMTDQELEEVARSREFEFVRGYALYRVGVFYFEQMDFNRARSFLRGVLDIEPDSELAENAQNLLNQIDARRRVDPRTIGAVLPLTGRQAAVGQRALRGLQLGLGIFGPEPSDFRLAVIDSEGHPDQARRAVERLIMEDHVIAIVGSLMSRTALATAQKAEELGVPSIALSQRQGITDVGNTVFRNALTSRMQVQHLVTHAMEEMGMRRFAILYPNDSYGIEYANLFWDEVLSRGGEISAAQTYSPDETDFTGHFQRLVGTYYLEDRADEYRSRFAEWFERQGRRIGRTPPPEDLLPPVVNFEAIFVPDGIRPMSQIAPMLAYFNLPRVKLLGTNLWNSELLMRRGQRHVESAIFVDGLLVNDPKFRDSTFFRQFRATFNEEPGIFEAQAFEAGLILRQLIASGERSRVGLARRLTQLRDFPGTVGGLNVNETRDIYRPLTTLTVHQGSIVPWHQVPREPEQVED